MLVFLYRSPRGIRPLCDDPGRTFQSLHSPFSVVAALRGRSRAELGLGPTPRVHAVRGHTELDTFAEQLTFDSSQAVAGPVGTTRDKGTRAQWRHGDIRCLPRDISRLNVYPTQRMFTSST